MIILKISMATNIFTTIHNRIDIVKRRHNKENIKEKQKKIKEKKERK